MIVKIEATPNPRNTHHLPRNDTVSFCVWRETVPPAETLSVISCKIKTIGGPEISFPPNTLFNCVVLRESFKVFYTPQNTKLGTRTIVETSDLGTIGYTDPGHIVIFSRKPGAINPALRCTLLHNQKLNCYTPPVALLVKMGVIR